MLDLLVRLLLVVALLAVVGYALDLGVADLRDWNARRRERALRYRARTAPRHAASNVRVIPAQRDA